MGIREAIAQHRRDFISIHDALRALSDADGCTYQEAAAWLLNELQKEDRNIRPRWMRQASGLLPAASLSQQNEGDVALRFIVVNGHPDDWFNDDIPF